MHRREFVKLMVSASGAAVLSSCGDARRGAMPAARRRLLAVAFDGLDPRIVRSMMEAGRLPGFSRLAAMGSFRPLGTSTPPHTPVAFASMISGADPGLHHVFDFIHRDPNPPERGLAVRPHFSTSDTVGPESDWALSLGRWRLPLAAGETRLLRRGPAFWDYLVPAGIDTQVYYLPTNYPPKEPSGEGRFRSISGMGTPDLLGGYGEFTLFSTQVPEGGRRVRGGQFVHLPLSRHAATAELIGPPNFLRRPDASGRVAALSVPLRVVRDPLAPVAKVEISGSIVLLNEGEWSDWVPVTFKTGIPGSSLLDVAGAPPSVGGIVRLYLKQVHPELELYVSPVNIDPVSPVSPISWPEDFAARLAKRHGRFYTIGIPEDTKALSHGALAEDDFLAQCDLAMQERIDQYRQVLADFRQGCCFFYFGATDLLQHMFWRDRDPQHPGYDKAAAERYGQVVEAAYETADRLVGDTLKAIGPDDTLLVLSDHGFTTFRRGFNLNSWLLERGYVRLIDPRRRGKSDMFLNVDWSGTRAYGLGLNALYLNAVGREKHGRVRSGARRSLLAEIRDELIEVRDKDGAPVIKRVDIVEDIYSRADPNVAPDLIVGYHDGYRASWETVLGQMPAELLVDNLDRWSGTHLNAAELVPGVLFANRQIEVDEPNVCDIAPTILSVFGISKPSQMTGRALFADTANPPGVK